MLCDLATRTARAVPPGLCRTLDRAARRVPRVCTGSRADSNDKRPTELHRLGVRPAGHRRRQSRVPSDSGRRDSWFGRSCDSTALLLGYGDLRVGCPCACGVGSLSFRAAWTPEESVSPIHCPSTFAADHPGVLPVAAANIVASSRRIAKTRLATCRLRPGKVG